MSWDFGQTLSAVTWDHLTRGEDGAFLLYLLPTAWKTLLVM